MTTTGPPLFTERLRLRELTPADAPFIVELLNDADFLKFIGDRGVRSTEDAVAYLHNGPIKSYRENGFGLYLAERLIDAIPIGICGLVSRPVLDAPDLGFALLPAFRSDGYALEASRAALEHGFKVLKLERVLAIVSPANRPSIALLEKLGMHSEGAIQLSADGEELRLFELLKEST
ncbi:MAG: GNAT family N-acetyltransferase [Woeseia sp.]